MFDPNRSDNVISIEFPNQIANGDIDGNPYDHLYSALRESFRLTGGESLEDCLEAVVTGTKTEATRLVTDLALADSEYTSDDWMDAFYNDDDETLNAIEDEFNFEVVVDIPPTSWKKDELLENNDDKYDGEDDSQLHRDAYKAAINLRNRNVFNPERTNDLLDSHNIDRIDELVVLSDGTGGTCSLVQQAMEHGTDVSTIAFNEIVENPPEFEYAD